jgi:carbonic anhydrase
VFDRTLGDLFIIRVAGNFVDIGGRASLAYAVDALNAPLIMVLGHERCGAVAAAVTAVQGGTFPLYLYNLVEELASAAREVLDLPGDTVDNAVRANVRQSVEQIKNAGAILPEDIRVGRARVVGAYYSLQSGEVTIID